MEFIWKPGIQLGHRVLEGKAGAGDQSHECQLGKLAFGKWPASQPPSSVTSSLRFLAFPAARRAATDWRSDGTVDVLRVVRGLPAGLTDSAIEAIKQWRFRPGQKDGQNADIALNIE